jgi:predicted ATPase
MSDGTLRALGILVSVFWSGNGLTPRVPLVGIEEPETALHPGAMGALLAALFEASRRRQILVTSHSPDLIDSGRIDSNHVLAVIADRGVTKIAPLSEANRWVLASQLASAGELLRLNQLSPDLKLLDFKARQLRLF